jgi:peptidoglycan hydrolase-like protein with peptidoglycan-binding domain
MATERQFGEKAPPSRRRVIIWMTLIVIVVVGAVEGFAITSVNVGPRSVKSLGGWQQTVPSKKKLKLAHLRLRTEFPVPGSNNASFGSAVNLDFSQPLSPQSPLPTLTPSVPGRWTRPTPTTLLFRPEGYLIPLEQITVHIPGGPAGIHARSGATLAASLTASFTVGDVPVLRLQQLLAELGYLPVSFTRTGPTGSRGVSTTYPAPVTTTGAASDPQSTLADEPSTPDAIPLEPETGSFQWRYLGVPSQLAALWVPGAWNVITQGALMAFEADHGLDVDGVAGPSLWAALLDAVAARDVTARPYTYLLATETLPETLYVWRAGQVVFQTPINTGVYKAPTPLGTWPVYQRFLSTTMKGTNPDGTKYDDPGVPWVSYFYESDAVHGFLRPGYGYPQSDGCVELPYTAAESVFPLDTYGTLVTITTGQLAPELGAAAPYFIAPLAPATTTTTTTTIPVGTQ